MTETVIGLCYSPWPGPDGPAGSGPLALLRRALWFKANPRQADYMEALFREHWPEGAIVALGGPAELGPEVARADTLVLLYPDAIGLGFGALDRAVLRHAAEGARVAVLNGRRRLFELDRRTRRQLALRRFLERFMLGEALFALGFLCATPVLVAADLARGRR